jgi:2-methylcitrate dehydratase PrpD
MYPATPSAHRLGCPTVDTAPLGLTRALASAVASSRPDDLRDAVARHALRTFVNFVGCAVGGSRHEAVECIERAIKSRFGVGNSCIIGRAACTEVLTAALLNGAAGAVNAFDDTHAEAVIHAGPPVGAALVALASGFGTPVRGDAFLNANAWGVELACRLSRAISISPAETDMGWSQTGARGSGRQRRCLRDVRLIWRSA